MPLTRASEHKHLLEITNSVTVCDALLRAHHCPLMSA